MIAFRRGLARARWHTLWLVAVLVGAVACRGTEAVETPTGRAQPVTGANAALLPTPTLAAGVLAATVDPLRPPTPIVLPSATPLGAPEGQPDEAILAAGTPAASTADTAEVAGETIPPQPTVALPPGATAPELLALGRQSAAEGDNATAAAAFRAAAEAGELSAREAAEAQLGHAMALFDDGQYQAAEEALAALLQDPAAAAAAPARPATTALVTPIDIPDVAAFTLGRARAALGNHAGAIEAYRAYAQNNPDMAAYVQPRIADAHLALGDTAAAIAALELAAQGAAQRFVAVENRGRLAQLYLDRGDTAAAVAQYDAIRDIARTEATKGQMTYLAGQAEERAGHVAAAQERYRDAVANYPRAADSYAALVALVDAGAPVDEYQRGVVDFYAGAYDVGIEALRRAIAANAEGYPQDAHLFLAWSYEGLGDLTSALVELDAYAAHDAARALFERGEMLARAGRANEALAAYDAFLSDYPDAAEAPAVHWTAAQLADSAGATDAAGRYLALADAFPFDDETPAALYRAGELTAAGDPAAGAALWARLAEQYPANEFGAQALFRLLQLAGVGEVEGLDAGALRAQVDTLTPSNYYALRARDVVAGREPFTADAPLTLADTAGQAEAETWLRQRLVAAGVTPPEMLGALSAGLAAEPGRRIGEKLWQLGLHDAAKAELETVREAYAGDAVANYQMALYFDELGLYRSSIIAAVSLLNQVGATIYDAPRFLGRLSFPIHYADLILPLAERYNFDPRLQFALVRQESLFESIARSGAAAQGLSQVIPDTGAWIAQRLAWPNYDNDDLFKPYVGLNFGAYYLSEQLRTFDGHVFAALAAYNGGPGNAARWYEAAGADHDRFVDTVDFSETRLYIQRIYEGFSAYRALYGGLN
ncbi:MAG TPA: transglycosylase SLT domain-containing protein [Promineifilum sp.]|nr:transglycosylase SLT domain-containing protein [Promineifilum sp.]